MSVNFNQLQTPRTPFSGRDTIDNKATFWKSYLERVIPEDLYVTLDPPKGLEDEELGEDEKIKLIPRMGVHVKTVKGDIILEGIIRMTELDEDAVDVADQSTTHHLLAGDARSRAFFVLDEKVRLFVVEEEDRRALIPTLDPRDNFQEIRACFRNCCSMNI